MSDQKEKKDLTPQDLIVEAKQIVALVEDRGQGQAGWGRDACEQAHTAARMALQALVYHYQPNVNLDVPIQDLFGLLSPSYIRIPPEVERATALSFYAEATGERTASGECAEAIALAQNVVSWAEIVLGASRSVTR
jgi:hypothetical protein